MRTRIISTIVGLGLAALAALLLIDDLTRTAFGNFVQGNAFWLVWLLPVIVAFGVSLALYPGDRPYSSSWDRDLVADARYARRATQSNRAWIITILVTVLAVGMWIYQGVVHGYQVRKAILSSVQVTDDTAPTFKERAAFDVANAQAQGNLGDVVGEIVDVTYAPDKDTYGALVERPGFFTGYAAVETQTVRKTGQATADICKFDTSKATARLGGVFGSNLERQIAHVRSGLIVTASDAYGVCVEGNTPMVVVPLKNHRGWFPAIEVPAGVATYNGLTGEVRVYDDVKVGDLPGPVFPISLAQDLRESTAATPRSNLVAPAKLGGMTVQAPVPRFSAVSRAGARRGGVCPTRRAPPRRASTAAMGSFWDYKKSRSGYTDTSRDEKDPNADNRSEFSLATTDGVPAYVSPLTSRRGSTSITAIGVVQGGSVTKGTFNQLVVHKLDPVRKANSAVADKLRTDYADLPGWSNGLRIFEIAPVSSTEWVASLGREQNVSYRVRIKADGTSCLENADGTKIRCGGVSDIAGNGPGVAMAPNGTTVAGSPVAVPADGQLSKLSDADLAKLQQQLANEVARRLTATK